MHIYLNKLHVFYIFLSNLDINLNTELPAPPKPNLAKKIKLGLILLIRFYIIINI